MLRLENSEEETIKFQLLVRSDKNIEYCCALMLYKLLEVGNNKYSRNNRGTIEEQKMYKKILTLSEKKWFKLQYPTLIMYLLI